MEREEQLHELVEKWQERQRAGLPVSPEELCRETPELLKEVSERIAALVHIQELMDEPDLTPLSRYPTLKAGKPALPDEPTAPPGYEIHAELGRGGMGVVYKAMQTGLHRLVALKMILAGSHASAEDRRRFKSEAQVIARLQHPNIVQIYDIGEHEGRAFLSLEFVAGGSLAGLLREQPLLPRQAAQLVADLAHGVQAAHAAGVIHRDLKPANVLLARRGVSSAEEQGSHSRYEPKITDFGLAKKLDEEFTRTHTGTLMGTPSYMAPEQATGQGKQIGPRADLYALGVILYECLTGRVPFRAPSLPELLDLVRHAEPVPPTRLNAHIPHDLETITLKCLQKEPEKRYGSAQELAEDLERYLDGRAIRARPIGLAERGWRWARRNRELATLGSVLLVTLIALVGIGIWFSIWQARTQATQKTVEARADAAEKIAKTQEFFTLLTRAREQIARPTAGWTWRVNEDLARAAILPQGVGHRVELRSEAIRALGAVDARLAQTLADTPRVTSVAWHPKQRCVAVGNRGGGALIPAVITLIDLDSPDKGEQKLFLPLKRVKMAPDIVVSLAFSPDGRCLVAGMRSGMLYRWELSARTAKLLPRQAHPGAIEHVLFSKDGKTIYSASSNLVKRWDGPSLEEKASWKGDMLFPCLAQHAVDGWISVSDDGKTQRLHPETLRPIGSPLDTHGRHFVLAPDGRTVILGHRRSLWVWDVEGNRLLYTLRLFEEDYAHEQSISDLALSPDGTLLLSASDDTGHVRLWDLISGQLVANLPHGAGHVKLAFSPDGRSFAVTGDQRTLIYELAGLKEQTVIARRPGVVQSFAMVKGGTIACVAEGAQSEQGEIALWPKMLGPEARPNTRVAFAPLSMTVAPPLALPENGRWLAGLNTGTADLRLWDTNGSLRASLPGELPGRSLAVAPDGRLWGAVGDELRAWELPSGNLSASWKNNYGILFRGASALRAVSAGRRWVVATGQDGDVRVFPAGKGPLKVVAARNVTRVPVRSVALSPDERWAVVGSDTGNIWLLSLPDAEVVAELPPRPDRIVALAWAANGLVVSGCYDGTVSVFHHEHERLTELFQLRHRRVLRDVRFCPESVGVAILLSGERGVRLWHLDLVRKRLEQMELGQGLEVIVRR